MTVHTVAWIKCDWCGKKMPQTHNAAYARTYARNAGWKRRRREDRSIGDICPQCLKKIEGEK